ncbi:hypothetical protein E3N88_32246 [Mikania micrantha]|uniref:Uncharacterized protein n=1 Tax=Mikania micrantha TaxID=192012 RepID=A0A5N6M8F7_9ASTR|nr:hypothetical protein E3N88_32246 [Mikania micrantha]
MKLGLLGSPGAHRGTRWPNRGPIAVRDEFRENLNPEIHRATRKESWSLSAPNTHLGAWKSPLRPCGYTFLLTRSLRGRILIISENFEAFEVVSMANVHSHHTQTLSQASKPTCKL